MRLRTFSFVAASTVGLACTRGEALEPQRASLNEMPTVALVELTGRQDPPLQAASTLRSIVEVGVGRSLSPTSLASFSAAYAQQALSGVVESRLDDEDRVAVGSDGERYWMVNGNVTTDYITTSVDIGADAARTALRKVVEELATKGVVSLAGHDLDAPRLRYVKASEGNSLGYKREWVNEYLFEVPRKVDGVEVMGAELMISIHRTGSVARITLGGPAVVDRGRVSRVVSDEMVRERFAKDYPNAVLAWSGLRYFRESKDSQTLTPCIAHKFSMEFDVNGTRITSRAQLACYSVTDATASPVTWPKPVSGMPQTPR